MSTTQKPGNSKCEYVMCCEWFNNLKSEKRKMSRNSRVKVIYTLKTIPISFGHLLR